MDIYTLNRDFQRQNVIDDYESLVWTERYSSYGDVVLKVSETPEIRLKLYEGLFLQIPDSREIMMVETCVVEEGFLTARGPSVVEFFKNRGVKTSWDNQYGSFLFAATPGEVPGWLVRYFAMGVGTDFVDTDPSALDVIPHLVIGPEDLSDPTSIIYSAEHGDLYSAIKKAVDLFGLGMTMYLANVTVDDYDLVFSTYRGKDRTSRQSINEVVRFQPALDSLTDVKELNSMAGYRNVAYAFAPNILSATPYIGYAYANAAAETSIGFDRRVLLVLADDIAEADIDLTTPEGEAAFVDMLNQRARNGLANNNYVRMVDGQIVPQNMFNYGVDYGMGDIVELTTNSGVSSYAQITEYIHSVDKTGHTSYPTLSVVDE